MLQFLFCFVFLLIKIITSSSSSDPFKYRFHPPCTHSKPLTQGHYELIPLNPNPNHSINSIIEVEIFSKNNLSTLVDRQNISLKAPYINIHDFKWGGKKSFYYNDTASGFDYEYIRARMKDENGKILNDFDKELRKVVWDYRFHQLYHTFNFTNMGPGRVIIENIPVQSELDKHTVLYFYQSRSPTGGAKPIREWCYNWISESNQFRWIFEEPYVFYMSLRSYTGYGGYSGLETMYYSPKYNKVAQIVFAVVCCWSNGTCPKIDPGHIDIADLIIHYVEPIPNDIQIPILEQDITILEGVNMGIPMGGDRSNPDSIDIELPSNITLARWYKTGYYSYEKNLFSEHPNCNSYHLTRKLTEWEYSNRAVNLAFEFNGIEVNQKYKAFLKAEGGIWQTIYITPKELHKMSKIPERLTFSDTWGLIKDYESIDKQAEIGYNYVPEKSLCTFEHRYRNFKPEDRKDWKIGFAPECSFFHHGNTASNPTPRCYGLYIILQASSTDVSYFDTYPISIAQRNIEMQKWQNSIDFYQGQTAPRYVDPCYDGILYKRHIEVLRDFLNVTKPDHVNFDVEGFSSYSKYLSGDLLLNSQNCMDRKLPSETIDEMYFRIVDQIFYDIKSAFIEAGVGNIPITWYGANSAKNSGSSLVKFETYKKYGIIPQPSMYTTSKNNFLVSNIIRRNKQYLIGNDFDTQNSELIPMPSWNTYGLHKPYQTFNFMIHFMCNGATGMMWYNPSRTDDMEHYLLMNEAISIFVDYEDFIFSSKLAFHDFTEVENCIISSIKNRENQYLVAVTSVVGEYIRNCKIILPYSWLYSVKNLRNKKTVKINEWKNNQIHFQFDNEKSMVLLISKNYSKLSAVFVGVFGGLIFVIILIVLLIVIIFISFKRNNDPQNDDDNDKEGYRNVERIAKKFELNVMK